MIEEMKTVALAARLLQSQYGFYARPMRDAADGRPVLLVYGGSRRDEVDLAQPDHRIRLSSNGLTWLLDGREITSVDAGGARVAAIVAKAMIGGEA